MLIPRLENVIASSLKSLDTIPWFSSQPHCAKFPTYIISYIYKYKFPKKHYMHHIKIQKANDQTNTRKRKILNLGIYIVIYMQLYKKYLKDLKKC